MRKDFSQFQKGQAIVLVALMMVALTGMLALSIDVGNSFSQRRLLQTAADAAAMAGAHLGMEQVLNGGAQDYTAQRNTAMKFANLNGASGPDTITIVWVDNTGAIFANSSNLPVIPPGKVVQGMKVTINANRNTFLFRALGIVTIGVTVTGMAQFGTANALVGASPLLMNNDTISSGNPALYVPFLVTTDNGGPSCCTAGQNDSLGRAIPPTFLPPATVKGPLNFHMLHDPPTDAVKLATRSSAANGISGTLSIGPSYYIDAAGQPADDQFALGMDDRILRSIANPIFAGDKPQAGKFSPYNPRVFMVAVNKDASGASPTQIVVFLAFYIEFVLYDASHKVTIGGYWVNSSGVPGNGGFGLPTNGTGNPMVFRLTQ
jgi:Flp pilus assembly protein TadG